jgi:hypothetical protein
MTLVSDIKLIRTDTTLDLSQKAEKGMRLLSNPALVILPGPFTRLPSLWDKTPPSLRYFYFPPESASLFHTHIQAHLSRMLPTYCGHMHYLSCDWFTRYSCKEYVYAKNTENQCSLRHYNEKHNSAAKLHL